MVPIKHDAWADLVSDGRVTPATDDTDVAVVDYMMPGLTGFETATRLKAVRPDCVVVIFSALDLEARAAEQPDVDRFVPKSDVGELEGLLTELRSAHRASDA
jgi:CheY-like chemotaxis protein